MPDSRPLPPPPHPANTVTKISPSLAARADLCVLSAIFTRDPEYAELGNRGSPFAALGLICHDLWEREGKGEFDSLSPDQLSHALQAAWGEAEAAAVGQLRRSLAGVEPPPPRQWRGYVAKRIGVLQLIKRAVLARPQPKEPSDRAEGHRPSVEAPIDIPDLPIRGRPDKVVWRDGVPHIVDLKTCPAGTEIRPEHRRQLLSYAYLWHAQTGIWPGTASIQYVDGSQHTIDVSPEEAEALASDMTALLDRINSEKATTAPESFATPSADACRWCPFKVACAPFFTSVTPEWDIRGASVVGSVTSFETSSDDLNVTLTNITGDIGEDITNVALVGVPSTPGEIAVGDTLAVVEADTTRSRSTLRVTWETTIHSWTAGKPSSHSA